MNINDDGAEIDGANQLTVYGEWIKFVDGEGSTVKIPPFVVKKLLVFALDHMKEFEEGAWDEEEPTLLEVTPAQMAHADAVERKPLSEDEIVRLMVGEDRAKLLSAGEFAEGAVRELVESGRAIERAHGIGEQDGS